MKKCNNNEIINAVANVELSAKCAFDAADKFALSLLKNASLPAKVLIGKDTRASCDMLEAALSAAFCSRGINVVSLGIIPTPALSYLTKKYKVLGAVAISSAQNTGDYNGITFFDGAGKELSEEDFNQIKLIDASLEELPTNSNMGRITRSHTALRDYVDHLKSWAYADLSGIKLAIDAAFGAGYESCKILFKELGADVDMLHNIPNGKNINENCGALYPQITSDYVVAHGCSAGLSFDGSCHSFVAVCENGQQLSGEDVERICRQYGEDEAHVVPNLGLSAAVNLVCALKNSGRKLSEL